MTTSVNETKRPTDEQLVTLTISMGVARPLTDGRSITCPKCENKADILDYRPLGVVDKYEEQLVNPIRCKKCSHIFALRPC